MFAPPKSKAPSLKTKGIVKGQATNGLGRRRNSDNSSITRSSVGFPTSSSVGSVSKLQVSSKTNTAAAASKVVGPTTNLVSLCQASQTSLKSATSNLSVREQKQHSDMELETVGESKIYSGSRSSLMSDTTTISVCSSASTSRQAIKKSTPTSLVSLNGSKATPGVMSASKSPASVPKLTKQRVPTLAMSLRDKDQQIKLLIKERDEQKYQAEALAQQAEQWRDKFEASELERSHVTIEADDEVIELRRLAQEFEDENKRLAERLRHQEQLNEHNLIELNKLEAERQMLTDRLEAREEHFVAMERDQQDLVDGNRSGQQVLNERAISRAKCESEIVKLKEHLVARDEQIMQLRSSLEMRKNETINLQSHSNDLERKLRLECERNERHLKRIDEINLDLKNCEAKLTTKLEDNEVLSKQVKQLRQDLRNVEEKLEQISLARKKDVDVLHNKLSVIRKGPTKSTLQAQPYKPPKAQDEIVRLQMEIRDLKDLLIDREAELDCNRRDLEVMRRKMETRTLEVDCNNQELARRCQDLLEQNRQSEGTINQLLKSTTDHSAQLMRATEELKDANGKCVKLREQVNELEIKLEKQLKCSSQLTRENGQLKELTEKQRDQIGQFQLQIESLNEQLADLYQQLDIKAANLYKDRELLADQLSSQEIDLAQLRHDLASARQKLRTSRLQTQEVTSERDRLRAEHELKEKMINSRNDLVKTIRQELEISQKSLADYKQRIETIRKSSQEELDRNSKEWRQQIENLRSDLLSSSDECLQLKQEIQRLQQQLKEVVTKGGQEQIDEMRRKHSFQLDGLKIQLKDLEAQLVSARQELQANLWKQSDKQASTIDHQGDNFKLRKATHSNLEIREAEHKQCVNEKQLSDDYETQIDFLNSVVVDMQKECDDYKNKLANLQTIALMNEFESLLAASNRYPSNESNETPLHFALKPTPSLLDNVHAIGLDTTTDIVTQNQAVSSSLATILAPARIIIHQGTRKDHLFKSTEKIPSNVSINNNDFLISQNNISKKLTIISGRPYCNICQLFDRHHTIHCPITLELRLQERLSTLAVIRGGDYNFKTTSSTNISGEENEMKRQETENEQQNNNYLTGKDKTLAATMMVTL